MALYIAKRIIEKANGGNGLEYKLIVPKWIEYKEAIDKILTSEGREDLIEEIRTLKEGV